MGVDILNRLYCLRKNVFLHPKMHFSTFVGSSGLLLPMNHLFRTKNIHTKNKTTELEMHEKRVALENANLNY